MAHDEPPKLIPIDGALSHELRSRLAYVGWSPSRDDAYASAFRAATRDVPRFGSPREAPADWTADWDATLLAWMGTAELEGRAAASGWIDAIVLAALRSNPGR